MEFKDALMKIRAVEMAMLQLMREGRMSDFAAIRVGQEKAAVYVSRAMRKGDAMVVHHAAYEWFLALGGSVRQVLEHALGKKGDLKTLSLKDYGFIGSTAIVGTPCGIAVGYAYAKKLRGEGGVVFCVIGDGATLEGAFYESLNVASLLRLPVLFVVLHNGYVVHAKFHEYTRVSLVDLASSFGALAVRVSEDELLDEAKRVRNAVEKMRMPAVLVIDCYRITGHSGYGLDAGDGQRDVSEVLAAIQKDWCDDYDKLDEMVSEVLKLAEKIK